jgi:thiamine-monophosphate kinase
MSDPAAKSIPGTPLPEGTVADLGEFGLISALQRRLPQGSDVLIGPGDDAAVLEVDGASVVLTTDVLVSGVHFRPDWGPAYDVGRRAAAASLADVAAMGARGTALVVAMTAPADLEVAWALRLADGLRDEAAEVRASVAGGDISRSTELAVTVTAIGSLEGLRAVTRSGAQVGDVVAVCGRLGWAEAGLAVLSRGFRSPRVLVDAYRRPEPPYVAGPAAASAGATAMCDVSDGLVADLGHVAAASGVGIDVDSSALDVAEPIQAVAAAYGMDPLHWVLTGGHDHALVATFGAGSSLPEGFVVIGEVVTGEGVRVDGAEPEGLGGHAHFSR